MADQKGKEEPVVHANPMNVVHANPMNVATAAPVQDWDGSGSSPRSPPRPRMSRGPRSLSGGACACVCVSLWRVSLTEPTPPRAQRVCSVV